jgi:hypothetical protein
MRLLITAVLTAIACFSWMHCEPTIAGNTSEIGNATVAGVIFEPDGKTPASNVCVAIRPRNTLAVFPGTGTSHKSTLFDSVFTDNSGRFAFDSTILLGTYVVDAASGNNAVLIDSVVILSEDSTVTLAPATLKPMGAIKGVINLSEGGDPRTVFVFAYGLDRSALVEADGTFTFGKLAENRYRLRIISTLDDYGVFDTAAIAVTSGDTTAIGVIALPYLSLPSLKKVTASYDTLNQRVTLSWDRPDNALVKSFNIYRRSVDPVTADLTHLNRFPVVDTVFIDSTCDPSKTFEYFATAVDSTGTKEGQMCAGVSVRIALYDILPNNIVLIYDTLRQTVLIRWSNPDSARVKSYNVYRRNIRLNEKFWTPFNSRPISDTSFIDSTFVLCPTGDVSCTDSEAAIEPTYEYCVAALVKTVREAVKSAGMPVTPYVDHLTPKNVSFVFDTLKQTVQLRWDRPDMTLIQGFSVFRRGADTTETSLTQINNALLSDTLFIDSTGRQNQSYEYRIASIVKKDRAKVMSKPVNVCIAGSFIADTVFVNSGTGADRLSFPNDIAVAANGDIYIVDQGNSRIQVFDSALQYKREIGSGILQYPLKVSVNESGRIFIANYNVEQDYYSIVGFDSSGAPIDTIVDSTVIYDIDAREGVLYVIAEGRPISTYSIDGIKKRSWRYGGQDAKWIVAGEPDRIFVSTGTVFPDKNKVLVFDSLGNTVSSTTLPYFPYAMAFDGIRQLLYVVCYDGMHGSVLHVMDGNNVERARYKIKSDNQSISIGIQKDGTVYVVQRIEGTILRLKPLFH